MELGCCLVSGGLFARELSINEGGYGGAGGGIEGKTEGGQ